MESLTLAETTSESRYLDPYNFWRVAATPHHLFQGTGVIR